jgi:hypothetical protein
MTPNERERLQVLCEQIATEQDPQEFAELVQQLNALLDAADCRLVVRIWTRSEGRGTSRPKEFYC